MCACLVRGGGLKNACEESRQERCGVVCTVMHERAGRDGLLLCSVGYEGA